MNMHPVERPRERILKLGAGALRDEELLALLLRTGYAGRNVIQIASELLRRFPKSQLARMAVRDLRDIKGVGLSRAAVLTAAFELARRSAVENQPEWKPFEEPQYVWEYLHEFRGKPQEHFVALYLNASNRLLCRETISIGTLTASLVHPREVFSPAVERRAAAVIVAHNHPSGELRPSSEDREVTRRIVEAGRILGIQLLDHVLITERGYYSFREQGCIQ